MTNYNREPLPKDAPKLMPFQDQPFNGDHHACEWVVDIQKRFGIRNCIETGTCFGSTTQFFAQIFEKVRTIEINKKFQYIAKERLFKSENIDFITGDSSEILESLLTDLDDNTFIFLDAHWSNHCPLIDELIQIGRSGLKPVIMIHDFYNPNHPEYAYDSYDSQPFIFKWIKKYVDLIFGIDGYDITYNDLAEGAKVGIIAITKKV